MIPVEPGPGHAEPYRAAALIPTFIRYGPLLQEIAIRRFSIPAAEAEELVDAVFSSYLERGPQVEAVEMFLIGAICNASRSYLRRTNAPEALLGRDEPGAATPGDTLLGDIDRKMLLGQILVACLNQPHLEMLHRYYRRDEGVDAIAAAMGVTRETVEMTLFE